MPKSPSIGSFFLADLSNLIDSNRRNVKSTERDAQQTKPNTKTNPKTNRDREKSPTF